MEILVPLGASAWTTCRNNQFVDSVSLGRRYSHIDARAVKDYRRLWFVDQEIEESQRNRVRLQGWKPSGPVVVWALIRCQEVHA